MVLPEDRNSAHPMAPLKAAATVPQPTQPPALSLRRGVVGVVVDPNVGTIVGTTDEPDNGDVFGPTLGDSVEPTVGDAVAAVKGAPLGASVGLADDGTVGGAVGLIDGDSGGLTLGPMAGARRDCAGAVGISWPRDGLISSAQAGSIS